MNSSDSCNGCKKKSLKTLPFNHLRICQNCLLISRKIEKKLSIEIKKDFKLNIKYSWTPAFYRNLKSRSSINFHYFSKLLRFVKFKKNDEILDFGSGYGPLLHILKQKKYKAIGIEPSIKNSKISKKLGHKVINNTLKKNTFSSKKFKVIISLYVFTYITDFYEVIKIFRKILKDNGHILIRVHQYKYSQSYWQKNHFKVLGNNTTNHFSNNSLKNLFNFHNFNIVLFESDLNGTTIIAKKVKKKEYKRIGDYKYEVFYVKHLIFLISNMMRIILKIRKRLKNFL